MSQINSVKIHRGQFNKTELIDFDLPSEDQLADGSVLFKLDIFGLSTNNVTYAVSGNTLGYWNFFPVDEEHSQLPVWGYGHVIASKHDNFALGDKYYGYFPMASHVIVQPDEITPYGFMDVNPARKAMNTIYNYYTDTRTDVSYKLEDEAMQVLYRPLFYTSYLLLDYLNEENYFGAERIIITSASSKTGYGLGAILADTVKAGAQLEVIGMTSPRNVEFVKDLGIYTDVITYAEAKNLDDSKKTVVVDFTGNQAMLIDMADRLGDALQHTALIGAVQNDSLEQPENTTKHGKFFFAPIQAQKCIERWGHADFNQHYADVWSSFKTKAAQWVDLEELDSIGASEKAYLTLLDGSPSPRAGIVVKI